MGNIVDINQVVSILQGNDVNGVRFIKGVLDENIELRNEVYEIFLKESKIDKQQIRIWGKWTEGRIQFFEDNERGMPSTIRIKFEDIYIFRKYKNL